VPAIDDIERAMTLREVMEHVVETAKKPPQPQKPRARGVAVIVICVLLLGASAYSWIARPEAIWGPSGAPVSPVLDDASARMSIAIIAQRLADARAQTGHYPLALSEIGEASVAITYTLLGDTAFVLAARTQGDSVEYRSDQPLAEFVGRSADVVARSRR
jgi:hypothetical protein